MKRDDANECRERAGRYLARARTALPESRARLLQLAEEWDFLAQQFERLERFKALDLLMQLDERSVRH